MRLFAAIASVALAMTPLAAVSAQAGSEIAVGAQVLDSKSQLVGTITAINGEIVTVRTDKLDANLGKGAFTPLNGKIYIGMNQAELNAAVENERMAAAASLAVGKPVKGTLGTEIGTIEAIDSDFVTLKLTSGKTVRVPRSGIAGSPDGAVVGITAEELESQAGG